MNEIGEAGRDSPKTPMIDRFVPEIVPERGDDRDRRRRRTTFTVEAGYSLS
jgi:hypothetical protein